MALHTPQNISEDGIIPVLAGVTASENTWENTGSEIIMIDNQGEDPTTIDVEVVVTSLEMPSYGEVTKRDASLTVTAGAMAYIGPFPAPAYNDDDGIVNFTFTETTSVTVAVLTIGN